MSNDGVPAPLDAVAVADGYRAAAARRGGGGRGGFPDLRSRRFRTALYYVFWGGAGIIMSTNVPSLSVNPDHLMLNIVFVTAGANLLLLSMAADDMPWMEPAAARLEGILARMIQIDF